MASWSEKLKNMTQTAMNKGSEVASVAKLNIEVNSLNQKLKEVYAKAGQYALENGIGAGDAVLGDLAAQMTEIKNSIAFNEEEIRKVKNISICPRCGASVSRNSRFCDKCGAEMENSTAANAPEGTTCKSCGAPMEAGAVFCANCGAKQE